MHCLPLLESRSQGAVQPVFEVQLSAPGNHVREKVSVEGRVLLEERLQVQRAFGSDELVQAHLVRGDRRPLLLDVTVIWIRAYVPDALENHCDTLIKFLQPTPRCASLRFGT
jgi:hypothetical protein